MRIQCDHETFISWALTQWLRQDRKTENDHIVRQKQNDLIVCLPYPETTPREKPSEIHLFMQSKYRHHTKKSFRDLLKHLRLTFDLIKDEKASTIVI